jgi:hypothetical protein
MFVLREAGTMSDILITPLVPTDVSQSPAELTTSETVLLSLNSSLLEDYVT